MLSMKVSTLRCSYLNKSNRVGLVPRGLHYGTTAVRKRKSSREDRIFKVGVKKALGGEQRAFDIFHGKGKESVCSPRPGKGLVLCYMEILRASCFRDKKPGDSTGHSIPGTTVQYLSANGRERTGQRTRLGEQVKLVRKLNQFVRVGEFYVVVVVVARNSQPLCLRYPVNRYERSARYKGRRTKVVIYIPSYIASLSSKSFDRGICKYFNSYLRSFEIRIAEIRGE